MVSMVFYGDALGGETQDCAGVCHVRTEYFCVQGVALWPWGCFLVVPAPDPPPRIFGFFRARQDILAKYEIGWKWLSVALAFFSSWAGMAAVLGIGLGAVFAFISIFDGDNFEQLRRSSLLFGGVGAASLAAKHIVRWGAARGAGHCSRDQALSLLLEARKHNWLSESGHEALRQKIDAAYADPSRIPAGNGGGKAMAAAAVGMVLWGGAWAWYADRIQERDRFRAQDREMREQTRRAVEALNSPAVQEAKRRWEENARRQAPAEPPPQ